MIEVDSDSEGEEETSSPSKRRGIERDSGFHSVEQYDYD
jgi:hypothetical protein